MKEFLIIVFMAICFSGILGWLFVAKQSIVFVFERCLQIRNYSTQRNVLFVLGCLGLFFGSFLVEIWGTSVDVGILLVVTAWLRAYEAIRLNKRV